MLAAEVDPIESVEEDEDGDSNGSMELPPIAIFAPGQWLSCVMVDGDRKPFFLVEDDE
jgi:hypothetical protein